MDEVALVTRQVRGVRRSDDLASRSSLRYDPPVDTNHCLGILYQPSSIGDDVPDIFFDFINNLPKVDHLIIKIKDEPGEDWTDERWARTSENLRQVVELISKRNGGILKSFTYRHEVLKRKRALEVTNVRAEAVNIVTSDDVKYQFATWLDDQFLENFKDVLGYEGLRTLCMVGTMRTLSIILREIPASCEILSLRPFMEKTASETPEFLITEFLLDIVTRTLASSLTTLRLDMSSCLTQVDLNSLSSMAMETLDNWKAKPSFARKVPDNKFDVLLLKLPRFVFGVETPLESRPDYIIRFSFFVKLFSRFFNRVMFEGEITQETIIAVATTPNFQDKGPLFQAWGRESCHKYTRSPEYNEFFSEVLAMRGLYLRWVRALKTLQDHFGVKDPTDKCLGPDASIIHRRGAKKSLYKSDETPQALHALFGYYVRQFRELGNHLYPYKDNIRPGKLLGDFVFDDKAQESNTDLILVPSPNLELIQAYDTIEAEAKLVCYYDYLEYLYNKALKNNGSVGGNDGATSNPILAAFPDIQRQFGSRRLLKTTNLVKMSEELAGLYPGFHTDYKMVTNRAVWYLKPMHWLEKLGDPN